MTGHTRLLLFGLALLGLVLGQTIEVATLGGDEVTIAFGGFVVNDPPEPLLENGKDHVHHDNAHGTYVVTINVAKTLKDMAPVSVDPATKEGVHRIGMTGVLARSCWVEIHNTTTGMYVCGQCTSGCASLRTTFSDIRVMPGKHTAVVQADIHVESECGGLYHSKTQVPNLDIRQTKVTGSRMAQANGHAYTYLHEIILIVTEKSQTFRLYDENGSTAVVFGAADVSKYHDPPAPRVGVDGDSPPDTRHVVAFWWIYPIIGMAAAVLALYLLFDHLRSRELKRD